MVYSCNYNPKTDTRRGKDDYIDSTKFTVKNDLHFHPHYSLLVVFSWKLSKTKELTSEANEAMNAAISGIPVLNEAYYFNRDQSDESCFYFPKPEPGVTVVFPGQCDPTIPVVSNFRLTDVSTCFNMYIQIQNK